MNVAVKICGLTDERGLAAAVDGGAAFVGFVFFRRSPRVVTLEQANELVSLVPRGVESVGLFVNPTDTEIESTLNQVTLDVLQLHGNETPERVDEIKRLSGLRAIKAIGVSTARDVVDAAVYHGHADWLLFDAKPPKDATRPGGNAHAFDWTVLKAYTGTTPWMLAGGLSRANVVEAIGASGARTVDVSSGVETKPGVKSPAKIRSFLKAVHNVTAGKA